MIAYFDAQGRYAWVGTPTVLVEGAQPHKPHPLHATHSLYEGFVNQLSQYHDVTNNVPVDMPVRPSANHVFEYATKTWIDPRTSATQWLVIRAERNLKLADCDWVVTKAAESRVAVASNWQAYRQALRDVTLQADPFNVTWPVSPDEKIAPSSLARVGIVG